MEKWNVYLLLNTSNNKDTTFRLSTDVIDDSRDTAVF